MILSGASEDTVSQQRAVHPQTPSFIRDRPGVPSSAALEREETRMPKYLFEISYTLEGTKGLLKDGGSKRLAAGKAAIESIGGKVEAFYFTFGEHDVIAIVDMPDAATAAGASIALAASGGVKGKTTVLLTPEEIDAAVKKTPTYTPPGR
jgi:uncharacterized protein with GYD domain